jgi:selenocysteine-specific elongation factor
VAVGADAPWMPSRVVDVTLTLDASAAKSIGRRQRVRLLLGTGEWTGWASPGAPIAPGSSGLARVTLDREIIARGGDRFVLRSMTPVHTIGGGEILDPAPPPRAPRLPGALPAAGLADRMVTLVGRRRHGVPARQLPVLLGRPPAECGRLAEAERRVTRVAGYLVLSETIADLAERAAVAVAAFHTAHPAERGMPLETLRQGLRTPEWLADAAIAHAAGSGAVGHQDGIVALRGFRRSGAGGGVEVDAVVAALTAAGLTPPTVAELAAQLGRPDVAASLRAAAAEGRADAVERDRYYARSVLDDFVDLLGEIGAAGEFAVGAVRDRTGLSRKFLIPLLEWSDARGWTVRQGDLRRFRGGGRL